MAGPACSSCANRKLPGMAAFPSRWRNPMNIVQIQPRDLIEAKWFPTYERLIDALYQQVLKLNSIIFVLDRIVSFPFDILRPDRRRFWNLVTDAFFDASILTLWQIAVDPSPDGLTLRQLKNELFQHLRNDDYRTAFAEALRSVDFESCVSTLEPKIRTLRRDYIAHFNRTANVDPTPEQLKQRSLFFSELKQYRDAVQSLFKLLCFARERLLLPLDYNPVVIRPDGHATDIDQLLDCVARESEVLNMPEHNPQAWQVLRRRLSETDVAKLNHYRRTFGLPEV
jgi:hypothetical protein